MVNPIATVLIPFVVGALVAFVAIALGNWMQR